MRGAGEMVLGDIHKGAGQAMMDASGRLYVSIGTGAELGFETRHGIRTGTTA